MWTAHAVGAASVARDLAVAPRRRGGHQANDTAAPLGGLYQRPRWALAAYLAVLRAVHHAATALGLGQLAMQTSNQLGGVSRELLLHDQLIEYTLLVGRRASRGARGDAQPLLDESHVEVEVRPALVPPY